MKTQKAGGPAEAAAAATSKQRTMREEILDAAADIIVSDGYDACTMRAVAARVNMKAGSLYYHFRSKDEIVDEILKTGIETLHARLSETMASLPREAPFARRLTAAVETHLSSLCHRDRSYIHVYEHLPLVIRRRSREMRERYLALWHRLFAEGFESGAVASRHDLRLLVPYVLGGLNRVPDWNGEEGAASADIAALAVATLLEGIGPSR